MWYVQQEKLSTFENMIWLTSVNVYILKDMQRNIYISEKKRIHQNIDPVRMSFKSEAGEVEPGIPQTEAFIFC